MSQSERRRIVRRFLSGDGTLSPMDRALLDRQVPQPPELAAPLFEDAFATVETDPRAVAFIRQHGAP